MLKVTGFKTVIGVVCIKMRKVVLINELNINIISARTFSEKYYFCNARIEKMRVKNHLFGVKTECRMDKKGIECGMSTNGNL